MSSKRKNSRPTKIADIYEAPELFETFEGNELCGNYSTNDAYVQIQRFLDHDSEGEFAKPGYDDLIIPMNIEFDELSKDEEVNTTHEEASAKRTRKGKIKVNKTKKVKREKLKTTPKPLKYVCSICNYKSKRSDHHKRHLMIHLKNKPIKCFVCKYNTGRSDHYKRHLLRHGFSHQKVSAKDSGDKKKKLITIKVKKEIIEKHERGVRVVDLAQQYDRTTSTICTILKKKDEIKCVTPAKGVSRLSKQRTNIHEEMEKLLLLWINEKQLAGDTLPETIIAEKARRLYGDLQKQNPVPSTQETPAEEFKASPGWFVNFKKRTGVHSVGKNGQAASSDVKTAEEYVKKFSHFIVEEGYVSQQVFNCDETRLFWKKMPKRTYITAEEKKMPGHKAMKDMLTLAFCANASGDLKIKPLLVYHSENPCAFEAHGIQKGQLQVMWRSNGKAWVTRKFFVEWVNDVFGPQVHTYLKEKGLPMKALLVLDNAPGHPPNLHDEILEKFKFIQVLYLPPNTAPILQPMNQQVVANFRKLYTKHLFRRCFDVTENTNLTLREFWKDHFNIVNCLSIIDMAWQGVTRRTMNFAWRKLWPECVSDRDFESFAADAPEVEEIVSLGKSLGLEVDAGDIDELVQEHEEELTTEELQLLQERQYTNTVEEIKESAKGESVSEVVPTSEINELLAMWQKVHNFVETYHPQKLSAGRAAASFNDNAVDYFRDILKSRTKQISLDRFLKKRRAESGKTSKAKSAKDC